MDYWKTAGSLEEDPACPICGTRVEGDKKFCLNCGYKIAPQQDDLLNVPEKPEDVQQTVLWDFPQTPFPIVDRVIPESKPTPEAAPVKQTPPPPAPAQKAPVVAAPPVQNTAPQTPPPTKPAASAGPGVFFEEAKKRIKTGYIKNALISLALTAVFGFLMFSVGFSSEMEWQIGFRYSDLGIPLPNWVISTVALLFCVGCVAFFVMSIKGFFTCEEYDRLLTAAKAFGDVQAVGQHLQGIPRNTLTKNSGHLRFDKDIFFYQKGEDVWLFPTRNISNIKPVQKSQKSSVDYYVEITHSGKPVEIPTKKKNTIPLANEILNAVRQTAVR